MAKIKITDLSPTGSKLFHDSESFLDELSDGEIGSIKGGDVFNYKLLLEILRKHTIAYNVQLTGKTLQTAFSNSINGNDVINDLNRNTIVGQTLNGLSLNNINTISG